ncbi:hypothetical protein SAMN05443544_1355 [Agromyces cerinus subsp. cerinus]|uniref:Uncharacterized protein n=1 Tax=Agromyces cerinus subsp. cerinus TaxID=232089 RepID=A0A1N6EPT2_9MICO|nr:hypothetical protein SAMN05443544_1355 [Agromyces cerinus subsp. cerinus]
MLDADGGVLASFDYFQPTTEVVAGLTEYLGEPVDTPNPGSIESSPGVDHEWGGLRLYDTDTPGTPPEIPNHSVFVTGPTAGPLPIGTAAGVGAPSGLHVGDPGTSVTVGIESAGEYTNPTTGRTVVLSRVGLIELPPHPAAPTEPRNFAVIVHSYTDTGLIEQLIAPSANFGV